MSVDTKKNDQTSWPGTAVQWATSRRWSKRPMHHRVVRAFRLACERSDAAALVAMLDPRIAVVVDDGDAEHPRIRVVRGTAEAIPLLLHGMARQPGLAVNDCPINGQAGLMVRQHGETTAAVNVDFTNRHVSVVWIRLNPVVLRHWNQFTV